MAFLFPGGGTQYVGMGEELYRDHDVYRDAVDRCARILRPVLGRDLRTVLFEESDPEGTATLLALVVTEYATARTLMESGVRPDALIGHSLGEYTAACLAGVMELEEMLPLVAERIRLIKSARRRDGRGGGVRRDRAAAARRAAVAGRRQRAGRLHRRRTHRGRGAAGAGADPP